MINKSTALLGLRGGIFQIAHWSSITQRKTLKDPLDTYEYRSFNMRKMIRSVRLTAPFHNKPPSLAKHERLVGWFTKATFWQSVSTNKPYTLQSFPQARYFSNTEMFLFFFLGIYLVIRSMGRGGKRDIITTSKAPKEKSEEVEGKTIIKIEFLLIKIHNFFLSFRNRTRLLWVYSGGVGGQLFFSLVLFSTCQDLVRRESTSMKVFYRPS